MNTTTKKRLLALLLCCMMVLTFMPVAALADFAPGPYSGTYDGKSFTVKSDDANVQFKEADDNTRVDSLISSCNRRGWTSSFALFAAKSSTDDIPTITVTSPALAAEKPVYAYCSWGPYYEYFVAEVDTSGNITFTLNRSIKDGCNIIVTQPSYGFDFTVTPSVTSISKNTDGSEDYEITCNVSFTPSADFKDLLMKMHGSNSLYADLTLPKSAPLNIGNCQSLLEGKPFSHTFLIPLRDSDFERGYFSDYVALEFFNASSMWRYLCLSKQPITIELGSLSVDFDLMGGKGDAPSAVFDVGDTIGDKLPEAPTKEGYTFAGWFDADGNPVTAETVVTESFTVYAGWRSEHTPTVLKSSIHDAYVNGYEDGTMRPLENVTRAEAATMLYRLLTDAQLKAIYSDKNDFSDVSADAWFNEAVSTLSNGGYILGFPDSTFRPDEPMTRAEFASVLARLIDPLESKTVYPDMPEEHWAHDDVMTATAAGWIIGTNSGFEPDRCITRAEVITALNRLLDRGIDQGSTLPEDYKTWSDVSADDWFFYDIVEATNGHEYIGLIPFENWTKIN